MCPGNGRSVPHMLRDTVEEMRKSGLTVVPVCVWVLGVP